MALRLGRTDRSCCRYGARFVNSKGEDFMKKLFPKLRGAKSDPHYNIRGMVL